MFRISGRFACRVSKGEARRGEQNMLAVAVSLEHNRACIGRGLAIAVSPDCKRT